MHPDERRRGSGTSLRGVRDLSSKRRTHSTLRPALGIFIFSASTETSLVSRHSPAAVERSEPFQRVRVTAAVHYPDQVGDMKLTLLRGLLVLALWPGASEAQVELRGRLLSAAGDPISGATIVLGGVGYSVRSDSTGRFVLSGQPGATLVLFFTAPRFRGDSASVVLRGRVVERDFTLPDFEAPDPEPNLSATMLRGRVIDESGAPLSYANVQVNSGRRLVADDSGRFQLPYPGGGASTVIVRRIGFEPAEVKLASRPDTALRVVLIAIPAQLREVTVTATTAYRSLDLSGFYGRMRDAERGAHYGFFITPEDIDRRKPTSTTQMADGFPNVRVYKSGTGPMWDVIMGPGNCAMTVYLDRIRVTNRLLGPSDFVNQLVLPNHMAAMEVYPRASDAPPAYPSANAACGVVLIWTK